MSNSFLGGISPRKVDTIVEKNYPLYVDGPLHDCATGYYAFVMALGYTPGSARWQIWVMAKLSQWLVRSGLGLEDINPTNLEQFFADYRAHHYKTSLGPRRLAPVLQYLHQEHLIPAAHAAETTPLQVLLKQYERFLAERRNLAPRTIGEQVRTAQRFMESWVEGVDQAWSLELLTAREPRTFLLEETQRLSSGAAKNVLQALRSFLRFCYQTGRISHDIAMTLPPVASWHATRLPPIVPSDDIESMLARCDRSAAPGRRDYAVLLLLARLGLRALEVCRLTLDSVDWRAGEITIIGKGRRVDRLPLPTDVGMALAEYLQQERPATVTRSLLLRNRAPYQELTRAAIAHIVQKACRRPGVPPLGPHRLRHALATRLLQQGATLRTIGQVLRHRDLESTAVYAKVDHAALQTVAQPWPEVHS